METKRIGQQYLKMTDTNATDMTMLSTNWWLKTRLMGHLREVRMKESNQNKLRTSLPQQGNYGVGVLFFPKGSKGHTQSMSMLNGHQRKLCKREIFVITYKTINQKRRIARGDTNQTGGGGHGYRRHEDRTSPETIGNDDVFTDTLADDDDQVRQHR